MAFSSEKFIKKCLDIKEKYDYKKLLKICNANIEYLDIDSSLAGYTIPYLDCHAIIINENLNENEQKFVIYHELAHIMFHPSTARTFYNKINTSSIETEANLFATIMTNSTYNDYTKQTNIQKIINYIYCNYLINNKDYLEHMKCIDYDYID